jgi:two-component system, sensor histidine kinase and response regulator
MSFSSKLQSFLQNKNTIYRLLLIGLFIASPSLHYLCFYNSFDPLWLRTVNCLFCVLAFSLSFQPVKLYYTISQYLTIISFLVINNCILLGRNGFEHVYLFSAITIFIALTLFCNKRWEFIAIGTLNIIATIVAYLTAPKLYISEIVLIGLLLVFTAIAYISFLVMLAYKVKFDKAISNVVELNKSLLYNDEKLREKRENLTALINSLNDIVFEFDENKICLNTWFPHTQSRAVDLDLFVGKRLGAILGDAKAKSFDEALDYVIKNRQPTSIEFYSLFDTGKWFIGKLSPVFDGNGNYTGRISASVTDISEQKKYENALKESEALLLQAQAVAKTGNWWYDFQTNETYWSKNMHNILEIDNMEEDTDKFNFHLSLIHPSDRDSAYNFLTNIHLNDDTQHIHKVITPKGNLKYFKILKGNLEVDEHGNPKRIHGITQDITDNKLSEKQIKVSQAELLEAQVIAKIGNWKWDIILNKLEWSDEINNIFDVNRKMIVDKDLVKLLIKYAHPGDRQTIKRHLKNISNVSHTSYEYRIVTPKGTVKHLSIIIGKIMRREDGKVRKIIGTLQDITDRKQAEIDYQRTENKFKLILETIKMPAISIGSKGNIIFCNKYMADLLGYKKNNLLELNWLDHVVTEDLKVLFTNWFKNNAFESQFVYPVICQNGEKRIISWQNTVSYDENGRIKEVTGIGEDITEREKATRELITAKEEAERSSRFKSEFLSTMSHEIRTPMNAVIGTTNLLLSEDPRPEQLEYLNTLKFSGENLLAIINDILDYNKIEAGKLDLHKAPFNIYQLVQKIKQSFFSKASEKGLQIDLIIDDDIPGYINGDQIRLGQILNNLISNAIKFTHNGNVIIRLEKEELSNNHVTIRFTVTDTGIGIAAENLAIIFHPFEQETQNADSNYGGTGLGLAITKRLIELHQSTIDVLSEPGQGTQFTFSITFDIALYEQTKDNQLYNSTAPQLNTDLTGMRILVVDDNKMNLLIASKFLKKWKAEVDEATGGALAIEMAEKNSYDLILMDLQMPIMDGFETTLIIKKNNPHIPVIALTADAMPETYNKAFKAGMCDYLTKPFLPTVLFEKIAKHYVPVEN